MARMTPAQTPPTMAATGTVMPPPEWSVLTLGIETVVTPPATTVVVITSSCRRPSASGCGFVADGAGGVIVE